MTSESTKQRINMAHGFMKSVIRNQIDRDNYDRELKAKETTKHHPRSGGNKPKKPEMQPYVPPQRSNRKVDSADYLYTLEYEHRTGEKHTVLVVKSDSPDSMARKIGAKFDLKEPFVKALSQKVREEMERRLV